MDPATLNNLWHNGTAATVSHRMNGHGKDSDFMRVIMSGRAFVVERKPYANEWKEVRWELEH